MTIVLVGAPGAGKTTVGQALARRLGCAFVDVDARIEEVVGKSLGEIFADEGEECFRLLEEQASREIVGHGGVVALGSGAVMNPRIHEALTGHDVIWLKVSVAQATRRLGLNTAGAPVLGNIRARLIEQLRQRAPHYAAVASTQVVTDDRRSEEIAEELAATRRTT